MILLNHFVQFDKQFLVELFQETIVKLETASKSFIINLPMFEHALEVKADIL